jgi:hypothetical protein
MALAGGEYEIRIRGRLSDSLLAAFEGLMTTVRPVETVLYGPVQDQARSTACWTGSSRWAWSWSRFAGYRHQPTRFQPSPSANRQIRRQARIVHGVLARAVLAAQVGWVVQLVCSCGAEYARLE